MSRGIVVDHKETGVRYAVSESNFNEKVHTKVRDLKPGESVLSYRPRPKESLGSLGSTQGTNGPAGDQAVVSGDSQRDTKTEGSPTGGTKEAK